MAIMAKTTKAKKGRKRGPKEKRLVITEDPQAAFKRLLNAPPAKRKTTS